MPCSMLDRAKVSYTYEEYECDDFTDGIQTADKLGMTTNWSIRHL